MRHRAHRRFESDVGDGSPNTQPLDQTAGSAANRKSRFAVPRLYAVAEVAAVLNVSIRTVRRLIADRKLDTVRIGRVVRIRQDPLIELIEGK